MTASDSVPTDQTGDEGATMSGKLTKCIGWGGRVFGHRFKLIQGDWSTATDYCTRCGMPVGGWR